MLPILMEEFSAPTWLVGWTVAIFIATINIVGIQIVTVSGLILLLKESWEWNEIIKNVKFRP